MQGIEYFTALERLNCDHCGTLSSLDVSKNTALTSLSCRYVGLTSLDLSKNTNLTTLYCENNQLTSLDLSKNTALTYLDCSFNKLASLDVSGCTKLTFLNCPSNQLTSLDVTKCTLLTEVNCTSNKLTSLDVSNNTALTRLPCSSNQLTSLDVSGCTALTDLSCGSNQLTALNVSKNTALTYLSCGSNQLTTLNVSKNTALTYLECYGNQLTSLDASVCTALTYLSCGSNQLTTLNVSKNTALTSLYCYNNQIKGAAMNALLASLPTVSSGDMRVIYNENEQNVMTTTHVAAAKAKGWNPQYTTNGWTWWEYAGSEPEPTEGIAINETNFPDENFRNWVLNSYGQDGMLTDDEIAKADKISFPSEEFQSLQGIEYFTALGTLYVCNSPLKYVDVSKNTELTYLGCSNCQLTSLDVSKNTKLVYLYCEGNNLTSLDVSQNTALKALSIYKNQIKGAEMDALVKSLPTVSGGTIYAIYNEDEGNVMTTTQVVAAKAKGWASKYMVNGRWQDYEGSEPEMKKCATPIFAYFGGKLILKCATEGVKYVCSLGFETDENISLPTKVKISLYATKEGYEPSDAITQEIDTKQLLGNGDLNGDGVVNMADVMFLVNKILKGKFPDE